jgi:hypothetical protein
VTEPYAVVLEWAGIAIMCLLTVIVLFGRD